MVNPLISLERELKSWLREYTDYKPIKRGGAIKVTIQNNVSCETDKPKTGRGNRGADVQLVMDYLRSIHPATARKITIADKTGIRQDRVLIILNVLSGICDSYSYEAMEGKAFQFLVYETGDKGKTEYGIAKDVENGLY